MIDNDIEKTAGIIIIGNEILSGRVHDSNAFYLASELKALGVSVNSIIIIPDDIVVIGNKAVEFSSEYDYVFTSGGIGPTHDDVTMQGIAQGFGVRLVIHPDLKSIFHAHYGTELTEPVLKMTQVPEGSKIIMHETMRIPLIEYRNIFIFPGIPEYLKKKFTLIKERFRSPAFHLRQLFVNAYESDIADSVNTVAAEHTDVAIGSYPVIDNSEYKVIITAESKSADSLKKAFDQLFADLPEGSVVKVE